MPYQRFVPVVDVNQKTLMPTKWSRAINWIRMRKATPFYKRGILCVRLNVEPSARIINPVCVGIDTGSRKEAYTVKSESHTYLNVQSDAVNAKAIRKNLEARSDMRRGRRNRKAPCRQPRYNRSRGGIPPSTQARWQMKMRILNWLAKIYPISYVNIEDIRVKTMPGDRCWNASFSPLEVGKRWFYELLDNRWIMTITPHTETPDLRNFLGLEKMKELKDKLSDKFEAHCVDSWALANATVGGHIKPDNKSIFYITPLLFNRRQLHDRQPVINGVRNRCGTTRCGGWKYGSLVRHVKRGLMYVNGFSDKYLSLMPLNPQKKDARYRSARPEDCKFLTHISWRWRYASVDEQVA